MPLEKITTRDGSATLYSGRYRQHYHNMAGAFTESRYVFFERTGLVEALREHRDLTICEVGFGSGFHLLVLEWFRKQTGSRSQIHYYSVEKYPVDVSVIVSMGFDKLFSDMDGQRESLNRLTADLASAKPGEMASITFPETGGNRMRATVYHGDFSDWDLSILNRPAHFFLHDAFSPDVNPELWSHDTFATLFEAADPQAVLGTYCSATRARAAMVLAGWHVFRAAGPPGKREMTLATPDVTVLEEYKQVNETRLRERFGPS